MNLWHVIRGGDALEMCVSENSWLSWRSSEMDSTVTPASLLATVLREHKQLADLGLESRLNVIENTSSNFFFLLSAEWQDAGAVCVFWLTFVFLAATSTVCHLDPFNRKRSYPVVRMQAWHAGTLGTCFKIYYSFLGRGVDTQKQGTIGTFTSMFSYASDTWESILCWIG